MGATKDPYRDFFSSLAPQSFTAKVGMSVVELGCGDASFLSLALESIPQWACAFGIDPDFDAIVMASERFQDDMRVSFIQAGGEEIPLKDSCADIVILSKALHHLERPQTALAQAYRILRLGGSLCVNEQLGGRKDPASLRWEEYHAIRGEIDRLRGFFMRPCYTEQEIEMLLVDAGLEKIRASQIPGEEKSGPLAQSELQRTLDTALDKLKPSAELDALRLRAQVLLSILTSESIRQPHNYLAQWRKGA